MGDQLGGSHVGDWSTEGWYDLIDYKAGRHQGRIHMKLNWSLVVQLDSSVGMGVTRRLTFSETGRKQVLSEDANNVAAELSEQVIEALVEERFPTTRPPLPIGTGAGVTGSFKRGGAEEMPSYACLQATLLECKGLKQMEPIDPNNVFVTVALDGDSVQSKTIMGASGRSRSPSQERSPTRSPSRNASASRGPTDSGTAPSWGGGAGEHMIFRSRKPPTALRMRAYHEETGKNLDAQDYDRVIPLMAYDLIGSHELSLEHTWNADATPATEDGRQMSPNSLLRMSPATKCGMKAWSNAAWYQLTDAYGEAVGEVRLFLQWGVPRPTWQTKEWQLHATVLECQDLKKMNALGKNDVFVQISAMGAEAAQRTSTVVSGGDDPFWSSSGDETMLFKLSEAPPSIGIEVYDEDHVSSYAAQATSYHHRGTLDRSIGRHVFEIKEKLDARADPNEGQWSQEAWYDLKDSVDAPTGRVRVRFEWKRDPLLPPPPDPLPKDVREIFLLLDEDAHVGGTLCRTVTYLSGSVKALVHESSLRFNRGRAPSRYHRSSKVFRDEFLHGRSYQDSFEECDVSLVYQIPAGLTGTCAEPVTDTSLVRRTTQAT